MRRPDETRARWRFLVGRGAHRPLRSDPVFATSYPDLVIWTAPPWAGAGSEALDARGSK